MSVTTQERPSPLKLALSKKVIGQSAAVAIVVGTTLNLINQGDVILVGMVPNIPKLALTYAVPFLVSTYGAWSMAAALSRKSDERL